jgi:hypothetical protein
MTELVDIYCPICGSKELIASKVQKSISIPYGDVICYNTLEYACETCCESFVSDDESEFEIALKLSQISAVNSIGTFLNDKGYSNTFMERVLQIPFGSISKWKTKPTHEGVALLTVIRTYPWILYVAEDNFKHDVAVSEVLIAAGEINGET